MTGPRFGVFLSPGVQDLWRLADLVAAAEGAGFDYVSIQDHPYAPGLLDPFALVAHLAARTSRIGFMTNVPNLPLRPAPMLAKLSATVDQVAAGRFELGLGGGYQRSHIAALGGPHWSPGETVAATSDAIDTIRALWDAGHVLNRTSGHYRLHGALSGPAPAHPMGIWLGAAGPRMLDLLGRKADGWIAPLSTGFETKPDAQDRIDAAAVAVGRDPAAIRRVIQLVGSVGRARRVSSRPTTGPGNTAIDTDDKTWMRIIIAFLTEERFDTVNLVPDVETPDQLCRFGNDVISTVRTELAP
jgi:alkanesulfonate monooxygenase SsuD/methylene tetrahydromethanopterin reductase-like flavin-dependent oxidoreductase (luciferase family)